MKTVIDHDQPDRIERLLPGRNGSRVCVERTACYESGGTVVTLNESQACVRMTIEEVPQ
jgi:hypothetical protein